jgi:ABC-2 type transport system ATP-binding protein
MAVMRVEGIVKRYPGCAALTGASLEVGEGRITGLLGPNGSGKTTLLKIMAGLLAPDEGTVEWPGGAVAGVAAKARVSFLPDRLPLPAWMKVKDAFAYWKDMYPDYDAARARGVADLLELAQGQRVRGMSQGFSERLALALCFSRAAPCYLLDEPLGGVDPVGKQRILETILANPLGGSAVLVSTHLVKDVEAVLDGFVILSGGKAVFAGDCEEIRARDGKTVEQAYLDVFGGATHVEAV